MKWVLIAWVVAHGGPALVSADFTSAASCHLAGNTLAAKIGGDYICVADR